MTVPAPQSPPGQDEDRQGEIQVVLWVTQPWEEKETAATAIALQETSPPRRRLPVNTLCAESWDPTQPHSQRLWHGWR